MLIVEKYPRSEAVKTSDNEQTAQKALHVAKKLFEEQHYSEALLQAKSCLNLSRGEDSKLLTAQGHLLCSRCYAVLEQLPQTLHHAEHAQEIFTQLGDDSGHAEACSSAASVLLSHSKFREAQEYLSGALRSYEAAGNVPSVARTLHRLGRLYRGIEQYDLALEFFERSYNTAQKIASNKLEMETLTEIGLLALQRRQYDNAIQSFTMCLALQRKQQYRQGEAPFYRYIGRVLIARGQCTDALDYLRKSLALYRFARNDREEGICLRWIGEAFERRGEGEMALKTYRRAILALRSANDQIEMTRCLVSVARLQIRIGRPQSALPYITRAEVAAGTQGPKTILAAAKKVRAAACRALHRYEEALLAMREYHKLHRENERSDADRRSRNLQVYHELEQIRKTAEIEQGKNAQLELKKRELEHLHHLLQGLSESRSRFLTIAARDLKTPLSSIVGHASYLQNSSEQRCDAEAKQRLQDIERTAFRMTETVTDILNSNALESRGRILRPELLDVGDLLRSVLAAGSLPAQGQGVTLQQRYSGRPLPLKVDASVLRQIVELLISNILNLANNGSCLAVDAKLQAECVEIIIVLKPAAPATEHLQADESSQPEQTIANCNAADGKDPTVGTAAGPNLKLLMARQLAALIDAVLSSHYAPDGSLKYLVRIARPSGD